MAGSFLTLNGIAVHNDELEARIETLYAKEQPPAEELALYLFLRQWFDSGDTMEIKTSGSTGAPKKYQVRKSAMIASARATQNFFGYGPGDGLLLCLSTDYIAGKMMVVRALTGGCNLISLPVSANPLTALAPGLDIALAAMVPLQIQTIQSELEHLPEKEERTRLAAKLHQIKRLLVGGSQISQPQRKFLADLPCRCYESYGMTETLTHIAVREIAADLPTRPFTPLPGVTLAQNIRGCLVISASHLGIKDLATSDLAELHPNGDFTILGRDDNVINTGSIKIHPEQVEEKLQRLYPDLSFFLFPVADPKFQNLVAMLIESTEPRPSLEEIRKDARKILEAYEIPKKVYYTAAFCYTESGKIIRNETIKMAAIK